MLYSTINALQWLQEEEIQQLFVSGAAAKNSQGVLSKCFCGQQLQAAFSWSMTLFSNLFAKSGAEETSLFTEHNPFFASAAGSAVPKPDLKAKKSSKKKAKKGEKRTHPMMLLLLAAVCFSVVPSCDVRRMIFLLQAAV